MPTAYVNLGVISTPEEAARLREMDGESPFLAALEAEILRFAGLGGAPSAGGPKEKTAARRKASSSGGGGVR